jgi:hypothetical protein
MTSLGTLSGHVVSMANGISADGLVVEAELEGEDSLRRVATVVEASLVVERRSRRNKRISCERRRHGRQHEGEAQGNNEAGTQALVELHDFEFLWIKTHRGRRGRRLTNGNCARHFLATEVCIIPQI